MLPAVVQIPLNTARLVALAAQYQGWERYERGQHHVCIITDAFSFPFFLTNVDAGGTGIGLGFTYPKYGLQFDGAEHASYIPVLQRPTRPTFTLAGTLPPGLTLSPTGTISGTPTTVGSYYPSIVANTGEQCHLAIRCDAPTDPRTTWPTIVPHPLQGTPYSFTFGTLFERDAVFAGTLGTEADGPYQTQIVAYDATGVRVASPVECLMTFGLWIDRDGAAKNDPSVIVQNGVYDWMHPVAEVATTPMYEYAFVPKSLFVPQARPLTPQVPVPFSDAESYSKFTLVPYVASNSATAMNVRRPCVTARGITVTENKQSYYKVDTFGITGFPSVPLLDGPRSVATMQAPTFLMIGRNQKVYGADAFSFWRIDSTGTKKTLFGLRHKYAPYWEDCAKGGPEVEVVGNWDASIPVAERFAWECWSAVWDPRSLALDQTAAPIGGEQPHVAPGPVLFACDRHGYILKAQFNATDHTVPPIMTRFFAANDPWAIGFDPTDNTLIVNERKSHKISKWNADTGVWVKDVVSFPSGNLYGAINDTARIWQSGGTWGATQAAAVRAACKTVLSPEGGALQDRWWYYGSYALGEVRRVNLDTGQVQSVCRPPMADWITQTAYIYLRVGDGTFGPRGTVFCSTFAINGINAYLPTAGTDPDGTLLTNSVRWPIPTDNEGLALEVVSGPGGAYDGFQYPMGFDVGQGMLAAGSSNRGLNVYMLADPKATPLDYAQAKLGWIAYRAAGYDLLFDQFGNSNISSPIPTDNANIAYAVAWEHQYEASSGAASALPPVQPPPVQPPIVPPPVVAPIQPPSGTIVGFTSVSKVSSSSYPPLPATGQPVVLSLHGSGGGWDTTNPDPNSPSYGTGDDYVGIGDATLGVVGAKFELHAQSGGGYGSTMIPPNPVPYLVLFPIDRQILGMGLPAETYHSGYKRAGIFSPYTERAMRAWIDQGPTLWPQADWTRGIVVHDSNSMGAWASLSFGLRQPDVTAIFSSQPRWKATSVKDWDTNNDVTTPVGLKMDDGTDYTTHYDSLAYIANPANALPFLCWTVATSDPFTPFTDHQAAIVAFRARIRNTSATNAQRTGFAVGWAPGGHGSAGEVTALNTLIGPSRTPVYQWRTFVKGVGYPVFDNSSLDDDPTTAAQGYINRGFAWRNVIESATGWSCEVSNSAAVTVDVYPHSSIFTGAVTAPQHVTIPAAQWMPVSFSGTQVTPAPTITNLVATPSTIAAGQSTTISATLTDTTSVTINGATQTLPFVDTPAANTTYVVVAAGPGGTATASVSVTVTAVDPLQAQLDAANAKIATLDTDIDAALAAAQKAKADE